MRTALFLRDFSFSKEKILECWRIRCGESLNSGAVEMERGEKETLNECITKQRREEKEQHKRKRETQ